MRKLAVIILTLFLSIAVFVQTDNITVTTSDNLRVSVALLTMIADAGSACSGDNEWYDWTSLAVNCSIVSAEMSRLMPQPEKRAPIYLRFMPHAASVYRGNWLNLVSRSIQTGTLLIITDRQDKGLAYFFAPFLYGIMVAEEFTLPSASVVPTVGSDKVSLTVSFKF